MANIIYRVNLTPEVPSLTSLKNSPLTNEEIDGNFKSLNDDLNSKSNTTHYHGNISSNGSIGNVSGLPLITGASGAIATGSFGTIAGTFCQGNDPRLSATPSISGGQAGSIPYQSSPNVTNFIQPGTPGQVLISGLSGIPNWTSSPSFISPILGTPASGNLENCTFPILNQDTTGRSGQSWALLSDEVPSRGSILKFSKNVSSDQPTYIWGTSNGNSSYLFDPTKITVKSVTMLGDFIHGVNGYQKFPGGLIIQWGSVTNSNVANFSIDFALVFSVIASRTVSVDATIPELTINYNTLGLTVSDITDFTWIAIGVTS